MLAALVIGPVVITIYVEGSKVCRCFLRVACLVHMGGTGIYEAELPSPVDLPQFLTECAPISHAPTYTLKLSSDSLRIVRERCTQLSRKKSAAEQAPLDKAADRMWDSLCIVDTKSKGLHTFGEQEDIPPVPPAFQFNGYDEVASYSETVLHKDQNALEVKPLSMSHREAAIPISPHDPNLVIEISVYTKRHAPITRKTPNLDGTVRSTGMGDSSHCDVDYTLAQKIECTAQHTLQHLMDEIVCHNKHIPASADQPSTKQKSHWTGANDAGVDKETSYPRFLNHSLVTDVCVVVNGTMYGQFDPSSRPSESYMRAFQQHTFSNESPFSQFNYVASLLSQTRFCELPDLMFHQPYWILHSGDCEHIWKINKIRLFQPNECIESFPRTVYLQRWLLTSLVRHYYTPRKLLVMGDRPGIVPCEICDSVRDAVAMVLGGASVNFQHEGHTKLAGMAHLVTPCCASCFKTASGMELDDVYRADVPLNGSWAVMPILPSP